MNKDQKKFTTEKKFIDELIQTLEKFRDNPEKIKEELKEGNILKKGGYADKLAQNLKGRLKMTQLRKVFHQIKKIQNYIEKGKDYREPIYETYPLLAYNKGRKNIPNDFYRLMVTLLDLSEKNKDIAKRTVKFVEAIVAYYKYYSPND